MWELAPQFGDLEFAEGGFSTALGKFSAKWKLEDGGERYVLSWDVPAGTQGVVHVPALPAGGEGKVSIEGVEKGIVGADHKLSLDMGGGQGEILVTRC